MEWKDKFSLGNEGIDNQHKMLFDLVGQIEAAASLRRSTEEIVATLKEYATRHFADEEAFMAAVGFPDLEAHREMHKRFAARVVGMEESLESGSPLAQIELKTFLQNWLEFHILDADMKIRDWVVGDAPEW